MREQCEDDRPINFSMERRFRVWLYTASHQTLALRSPARFSGDDTVDVWFDGVEAMNLHKSFESLTIRAADSDERARILAWAAADVHDADRRPPQCLVLTSAGPDGFVVCANMRVQVNRPGPTSDAEVGKRINRRPALLGHAVHRAVRTGRLLTRSGRSRASVRRG